MKNKILIFFFCLSKFIIAQQNQNFSKAYLQNIQATGVSLTSQNDHIIIAEDQNQNAGVIVKINKVGNVLWTRQYSNPADSLEIKFTAIIRTQDSNFIAIGNAMQKSGINGLTHKKGVIVLKINSNGDTLWTKTIVDSTKIMTVYGIEEGDNNDYLITGNVTEIFPFNVFSFSMFVAKLNVNGDLIWSKTYKSGATYLAGSKIKKIAQNRFIVFGIHSNSHLTFPSSNYLFLSNIDSNGTLLWSKVLTTIIPTPEGVNMCIDSNKAILMFHYNDFCFVSKMDVFGNFNWLKKYPLPSANVPPSTPTNAMFGSDIRVLADGGFLYCNGNRVPSIVSKIDVYGNTIWTKSIQQSVNFIGQMDTSGYVLIGNLKTSYENPSRLTMQKMNVFGISKCATTFNSMDLNAGPPTYNFAAITSNITTSSAKFNFSYSNTTLIDSNLCNSISTARIETFDSNISIKPNPSTGIFNFNINLRVSASIEITTLIGQKLFQTKISSNTTAIDLSQYPKGIYFYKLHQNNQMPLSGRLIIE